MKVATFTKVNYNYPPLESRPFPDYESFGVKEMVDDFSMMTRLLYRYSRPDPRPFNIVASRSCPFACTFCIHGHDRPPYRARSIPDIMEELKVMYEKYKFNILIIMDELFAVNKTRIVEFCNAVLEGKKQYGWDFDWMFQTHANARFDLETLKLAKEAGCFFFSYGLESASPRVLKSMNKKMQIEQVVEAIKLAREAKIGFGGNLIFGDIAETEETFAESLAFWFKYCVGTFVFLADIRPYPGSKLFDVCREKGIIPRKKEYYENIDKEHFNMTSMSNKRVADLMSFVLLLERSWFFVKPATDVVFEEENTETLLTKISGSKFYKITAECPYCGEKILYRQIMKETKDFWLGTGCPKCGQKIKLSL